MDLLSAHAHMVEVCPLHRTLNEAACKSTLSLVARLLCHVMYVLTVRQVTAVADCLKQPGPPCDVQGSS